MATVIDSLMITMGIDSSGVKSGMAQSENIIASSAKNIMSNILAPLAAAFALGSAFKEYISNASSVAMLSDTLGESVEDIGTWSGAVERAGGDASTFQGTISSLNDKMLEFSTTGSSSIAPVLSQFGISARKSNGEIKSSIDILEDLSRISDTMDNKRFTSLAQQMGIDNGTIMLLKQGSMSVSELIERQRLLGVYSKQDGEIAMQMMNAFKDLMQVLKSISAIIMRFVLPPITFLTNKLVDFVLYIREHEVFLRAVISGIAGVLLAVLLPAIIKIGAAMLANPLTWIFIGIAAIVLMVSLLIEDLYVYMKGGQSALSGFWSIFGTGQQISEKLSKIWVKLKEIFSSVFALLGKQLKVVLKILGQLINVVIAVAGYIGNALSLFKSIFSFDGEGIKKAFSGMLEAGEKIVDIFIRIGGYIKDMILNFLGFLGLKDSVLGFFNMLGEVAGKVLGKIKDFLSPIIDGFKSIGGSIISFFKGEKANISQALPVNMANNTKQVTSSSSVSVGNIVVNSQNTDPTQVAAEIPNAINNKYKNMAQVANSGVSY